jgi:hypothetical protein
MPQISLLEPVVLRGVVEDLNPPDDTILSPRLTKTPYPYPSVVWDVIRGSRQIAKPNIPNSEAHIVPRLGVSQESASFVYLREKKVFEPTTLHWLRTPGQLAARNAEAAVLREVKDLNNRFDQFIEWMCWQALTGYLTFDYEDVRTTVDYKLDVAHRPTIATGVSNAATTSATIRGWFAAWKRLMRRTGRVDIADAWLTQPTMDKIINKFAADATGMYLSDRMKDELFRTGTMSGFLGLNWHIVESTYSDAAGTLVQYVPDDALALTNFSNNALQIYEGPTADDEAPDGHTGKFTKTWKEKDPSARQILLEWHGLPVIERPDQFIWVSDIDPGVP